MAIIFNISDDGAKIGALLQSYFESGNLNFLIGSGASAPALQLAGDIEAKIDAALKENASDTVANKMALAFIQGLTDPHTALRKKAPEVRWLPCWGITKRF